MPHFLRPKGCEAMEQFMAESERWYSVKEVAARYGVSVDTIRRRIRDKVIRAVLMSGPSSRRKRVYKSFRISESELIRFEQSSFA